jgi:nucleoside-diphosphate-sugar epimerase
MERPNSPLSICASSTRLTTAWRRSRCATSPSSVPGSAPDMAFSIFCRAILSGEPIRVFGNGTQTRDFTFVADVVTATRAAALSPKAVGGTYNIGGGSQVSLLDALAILESLAADTAKVEYLASPHGEIRDTRADVALAERDLAYAPETTLESGLKAQFDWTRALEHR